MFAAYMLLSRALGDMRKVYLARVRGSFAQEALPRRPAGEDTESPAVEPLAASSSGADMAGVLGLSASPWEVVCRLPLRVDKHRPGRPLTVLVDQAEGKPAVTSFRLVSCSGGDGTLPPGAGIKSATSLVLCQPRTGRTHQIRAHLAALGFPIVGDPVYGDATDAAEAEAASAQAAASAADDGDGPDAPAMCLHAAAYAIPLDANLADDARDAGGEALRAVLPPTAAVDGGLAVYRCARSPAWAGAESSRA
mmetsp:Transcript_43532/g.136695  ORF Transcript_43532/g.136695 Transcript_43532/m.136695 type:complete len:251 (+) Transcript_43532:46-798(+)